MTVFIVQEMRGRDITDASEFGDLEILLTAKEQIGSFLINPNLHQRHYQQCNMSVVPDAIRRRMLEKLKTFSEKGFLLLAGDPAAIALASAIVSYITSGCFKVLKWDRLEQKYFPLLVDNVWQTQFNYLEGESE